MLHALLHRKLDPDVPEPQRHEDTLTSIVFGTLVLVDAWAILARWLGVEFPSLAPGGRVECECWFWPRLAGAVEPDVVLRLGAVLVGVEAKYRSGRNDLTQDSPEDEKPVDQIVRQFHALSPPYDGRMPYPEPLERAVRGCRLVQAFVVDGRRMRGPRREYEESKARLPPNAVLNLVTWQGLYKILLEEVEEGKASSRWSSDIRAYLRLVGLDTFQGIRRGIPPADELRAMAVWREHTRRGTVPGVRAAVATLAAEPAVIDMIRWRVANTIPKGSKRHRRTR